MSVVRVVMSATILGQVVQNVLHFNNPDGALTYQQIRDELVPNWTAVLNSALNNGLVWREYKIQTVSPAGAAAEIFVLSGIQGSLVGAPAPPVLCPLVRIRTGVAGRSGHGRFYIFGLHQDSVQNGVFQTDALNFYKVQVAQLQTRYKTGGTGPIQLVVCPRSDPSDFKLMTSLQVQQVFGVQRRRNIGVGG